MTEQEKWTYLAELDEKLLQGGVILSEWATCLVKEADTAFAGGANLASIITALAAVETHLRAEGGANDMRLAQLIAAADLDDDLKKELQALRVFRNRWVHVEDPWDDKELLNAPERHESELEQVAKRCAVALRRTIHSAPWV